MTNLEWVGDVFVPYDCQGDRLCYATGANITGTAAHNRMPPHDWRETLQIRIKHFYAWGPSLSHEDQRSKQSVSSPAKVWGHKRFCCNSSTKLT
ncbi:hypothetical protein HZ326_24905 [Fusarium oxysporum f. sp. albedinis]|nr:hypothetical protein HZ326_24905 [Fusarium oxysporum f. sp. albedinis]